MHDLNRAIQAFEDVLESIPNNHPMRLTCLGELATAFQCRYDLESINELDRAIATIEQIVSLMPKTLDFPTQLMNLAYSLLTQFERNGNLSDISNAIDLYQR
jgi:tetratricopeptide (TPR) repeat protein